MDFEEFESNNGKQAEVKPCCTDLMIRPKLVAENPAKEGRSPDGHLGGVRPDHWDPELRDYWGFPIEFRYRDRF